MLISLKTSLLFAKKIRQSWRQEAAHLPLPTKLAAFTLIELSIVLVIIGVIVGGVLVGQDLIHSAKLNKAAMEVQNITTVMNTFHLKYNAMPGDMNNATTFWGAADGNDGFSSDCYGITAKNMLPCNGDGDRIITYNYESLYFWEHLRLAGLTTGEYHGELTADRLTAGENIPDAELYNDIGIQVMHHVIFTQGTQLHARLGNVISGVGTLTGYGLYTIDAQSIDKKFDDGNASTGKILSSNGQISGTHPDNCTTGYRIQDDVPGTTEYTNFDQTLEDPGCLMAFVMN